MPAESNRIHVCRLKKNAMDISTVEVERTKRDVPEPPVVLINSDVPMAIVVSTLHSSAITRMIVAIILMKLHAVSSMTPFESIFNNIKMHNILFSSHKTSRHVTEANFDVPMLSVYLPTFTVTVSTIALMRAMKQIVRQSHVPTTNFSVQMAARIVCQSVLPNHSCAMEREIAMMAQTRKRHAQ
jgi:hypothetical protein